MKPRQEQIMTLLRGRVHGMRCAEIAADIGLGQQRTAEWLRSLRKLGLILPTADGGQNARWAETQIAKQIRAERDRMMRKERHRLEMQRYRLAKRAAERAAEQAAYEAFLAPPRQATVAAAQATHVRPPRPATVFAIAD